MNIGETRYEPLDLGDQHGNFQFSIPIQISTCETTQNVVPFPHHSNVILKFAKTTVFRVAYQNERLESQIQMATGLKWQRQRWEEHPKETPGGGQGQRMQREGEGGQVLEEI